MAKPKLNKLADASVTKAAVEQAGRDLDDLLPGFVVELPYLADLPADTYRPIHVEARLDPEHGETLARLFNALDEGGLRLASGRRIASNADAVKWLLEAVADASRVEIEESDESEAGS